MTTYLDQFTRLAGSAEFGALRETSARIGSNPLYVQGPGGNTSIKSAGVMWIKASGTWLADAEKKDIMVPVRHDRLLQAISDGEDRAENALDFVEQACNPVQLRPSIETTVHAVMPGAVVLHDHCVETIALAVRSDARQQTESLLHEFGAVYVPYTKPGLELARSISAAITADTQVVVLGNHGLIVAANTVAEAEGLLVSVAERLSGRLHAAIPALDALDSFCGQLPYQPAESDYAHALARDPARLGIATGGSLYPDHVIFLEHRMATARAGQSLAGVIGKAVDTHGVEPVVVLVEGMGVLVHNNASAAQSALVQCLGDVLARVDLAASLDVLGSAEISELLDWDAEKYRQSLDSSN